MNGLYQLPFLIRKRGRRLAACDDQGLKVVDLLMVSFLRIGKVQPNFTNLLKKSGDFDPFRLIQVTFILSIN